MTEEASGAVESLIKLVTEMGGAILSAPLYVMLIIAVILTMLILTYKMRLKERWTVLPVLIAGGLAYMFTAPMSLRISQPNGEIPIDPGATLFLSGFVLAGIGYLMTLFIPKKLKAKLSEKPVLPPATHL